MEQVLIGALRLTALCVVLRLTIVVEVVMEEGSLRLHFLGEELLYLLILAH